MTRLLFALLRRVVCPWCRAGYDYHTNALSSIGGSDGRRRVFDIHQVEDWSGVSLRECRAYDLRIWLTGQR